MGFHAHPPKMYIFIYLKHPSRANKYRSHPPWPTSMRPTLERAFVFNTATTDMTRRVDPFSSCCVHLNSGYTMPSNPPTRLYHATDTTKTKQNRNGENRRVGGMGVLHPFPHKVWFYLSTNHTFSTNVFLQLRPSSSLGRKPSRQGDVPSNHPTLLCLTRNAGQRGSLPSNHGHTPHSLETQDGRAFLPNPSLAPNARGPFFFHPPLPRPKPEMEGAASSATATPPLPGSRSTSWRGLFLLNRLPSLAPNARRGRLFPPPPLFDHHRPKSSTDARFRAVAVFRGW